MSDNFADLSFAENPDPRCPVMLVLDTSGSMADVRPGEERSPIDALNAGLQTLVGSLQADPLARRRAEVAIVTCGMEVSMPADFATVDHLALPHLEAAGPSPLGAAIDLALDVLDGRKRTYRANGVSYYRPWLVVISDGLPTDDTSSAAARIRAAEASSAVAAFVIGIEGADMDALAQLCTRTPLRLSGMRFEELFVWLSASQSRVSASQPGESVALPSPTGWAEI